MEPEVSGSPEGPGLESDEDGLFFLSSAIWEAPVIHLIGLPETMSLIDGTEKNCSMLFLRCVSTTLIHFYGLLLESTGNESTFILQTTLTVCLVSRNLVAGSELLLCYDNHGPIIAEMI